MQIVKMIDQINKVVKILVGIFIAVMAVTIILQVFSRYVLGSSLTWSEEMARYFSIYAVFFGAALALRRQNLIAVEVLHEFLPKHITKWLKLIVQVICVVFFIVLIVQGFNMMDRVSTQQSPALQISMLIPYASIPIGGMLMILNSFAVSIELLKGVNEK
ncbi:C4-dicarboxylate transport system permease small protein [Gracilibacillus halophilus YIM-C55.5]|uniref:C4-dicarboxylate transport system permease small protein n=1 Tax=Gracilibacillus halophilus YIM-C55.5 TaxID=1308866 RepID=N4WMZ7_9BACI|nr:TRAP transporter small permease [Gracilibacillus halophilus]ENH95890.1 C4-dicarboxylate transport system permease small protein [Gracilibacillus halophilus YIM-C55.5]